MSLLPRLKTSPLPPNARKKGAQTHFRLLLACLCGISGSLPGKPALAGSPAQEVPVAPAAPPSGSEGIVERIYEGAMGTGWQDLGWLPRDTGSGQAARLNFADNGGWVVAKTGLTGTFTALVFELRAPAKFGDFLEVQLGGADGVVLPVVAVAGTLKTAIGQGWQVIRIPLDLLNPKHLAFERVMLRARKPVDTTWVELAHWALMGAGGEHVDAPASIGKEGAQAPEKIFSATPQALSVDCSRPGHAISPLIYGIAYNPRRDAQDEYVWKLGASIRRFGGNPATRYNWRLGNAWNTANDWFYMNVNYTASANYSWQKFLGDNQTHQTFSAITVPMLGWVAKDTQSYSYPVSVYGPQRATFGANHDIGNGLTADGELVPKADPRRTSIPINPEFVGQWVSAIRRYEDDHGERRNVSMYFLDNEPMLWNSTHHDLHPDAVTYDELLAKTIKTATAIRRADPGAVIAGPSAWGWPAYFFSAADAKAGFGRRPDRLAHGDVPLLAWYLKQLHAHETTTGDRLLDVLDVHFYPEAEGLRGAHEKTDEETSAKRIRATRSLWDPTYKDESWIADRIRLIPRLRAFIADNYPGLGISLGEYNFGGENHMSGALAEAEVLGRLGQQAVTAAYYWTYPPDKSPVFHAFRAFRDYDGQGGRFPTESLVTKGTEQVSLFAARDASSGRLVLIALNLSAKEGAEADVQLTGCGSISPGRTFSYTGDAEGLRQLPRPAELTGGRIKGRLPPYSITVFELEGAAKKH